MLLIVVLVMTGMCGGFVSGKQNGVDLTCNGDSMLIGLDTSRLLTDTSPSFFVHLIDPSCYQDNNGANTVTIATTYNKCGTLKQVHDTSIVYSNRVYIQSTNGENLEILVKCEISRRDFTIGVMSSSSINDLSSNDTVNVTLDEPQIGYGAFYVTMDRYTDENFTNKFPISNSGKNLGLDQDLFFEVQLRNVEDLRLNLESCWATVESSSNSQPQYEFISNGCKKDDTVLFYNCSSPSIQRYSFRSFVFKGYSPEVYIHCKVFICDVETNDCIPSCTASRSRRRRSIKQSAVITRDIQTYQLHQLKHYL